MDLLEANMDISSLRNKLNQNCTSENMNIKRYEIRVLIF